jgi:hypothetical protein
LLVDFPTGEQQGRYEFVLAKSIRQGKLRPLRDHEQPDDLAA